MAVNINELRALTPPAGMPFKIQRLEAAAADPVIGEDTIIARSVSYDLRKDTGRVYGDTTKRPARGRR